MSKHKTGLYWFTNDLRVQDNPALAAAAQEFESLACVFVIDPAWFRPNRYGLKSMGERRWHFLVQSLESLQQELAALGQELIILCDRPVDAFALLITLYDASAVYRSENAGYYEQRHWRELRQRYQLIKFKELASHTLFQYEQLPFSLDELPGSFSKFRKLVEPLSKTDPIYLDALPAAPAAAKINSYKLPELDQQGPFAGGERAGLAQLDHFFKSQAPSSYKDHRNELDGWSNSTKFSPWLANGSVSVQQVLRAVCDYENRVEENQSTYWIKFELLWREYFQWYAHKYGARLFARAGIGDTNPLKSFYPERFSRWCQGNTPYPLVNACMKQLNNTGYMSNRGRQLVASSLINELQMDWRYGAAYFEQQLLDYDVASNWGNWQYIAGVGADPRGGRHFNIEKQTQQYDAEGEFISRWQGEYGDGLLDSVDASDWPLGSP